MIYIEKEFTESLFEMVSEMPVNEIEKQIKIYLTGLIKMNKKDFSDLGDGFISTYDEWIIYTNEFEYRFGAGRYLKTFQNLMIPAGLMTEEDRI